MENGEYNRDSNCVDGGEQYAQRPQFQRTPPPENHLALAILTTFFCCLPLGIVSLVYSAKVNNLWAMGFEDAAKAAARKAKRWALAAMWTAVILVVLYVLFVFVLGYSAYTLGGGSEVLSPLLNL